MKISNNTLFAIGCLLCSGAYGQTCFDGLTETTPQSHFVIAANGLVEDTVTGLMWTRCSYGQSWNAVNSTCNGASASITWQDALQLSPSINEGGFDDWRLPSIKELATLVEQKCVDPAINSIVFPATPAENYWTSTTVSDEATSAWAMAFYNGRNNTKEKLLDLHTRFVRYSDL